MKQIFQLIIFGALLISIFACDRNQVFEEYKTIPQKNWHKDSLVVFNIPVTDTTQNHNLIVNIRNDINYKYSNLWLFIEVQQPGGEAIKDTFELSLADPSGKWLGDGFGGLKTRHVIFRRNVYFPATGNYQINIQQGMREELLAGISDVGFRVEKLN